MHVLIATDGSEQAVEAARFLRGFANPHEITRVTVIAVNRPIEETPFFAMGAAGISAETWEALNQSAESGVQAAIERTVAELSSLSVPIATLVRDGSPAEEIVDAARELHADLVVLGSRGWGAVRSVFLGSVSERVLHLAHCPVLVVRPAASGA